MVIGEDPRKAINEYSRQFQHDFVQLLRTGHGEKKVNVNHFYQEYIANKTHIHMNATRWASLTEFAKHLGREGICRVEVDEKNVERGGASGLMISWIDNSPEALRRQDALKRKERQDRGDEEREQRLIEEQIRRAKKDGLGVDVEEEEEDEDPNEQNQGIRRRDGEKIVLNFGTKKDEKPPTPPLTDKEDSPNQRSPSEPQLESESKQERQDHQVETHSASENNTMAEDKTSPPAVKPIAFGTAKPKNVFASMPKKNNALSGAKKPAVAARQRPMSAAEQIMRDEIERKRQREFKGQSHGGDGFKKQRIT